MWVMKPWRVRRFVSETRLERWCGLESSQLVSFVGSNGCPT
jgi:hypothetical protein